MPVLTDVEPRVQDLDDLVRDLEHSWTATITVRRQSQADVGYREIFVLLDGERIGVLQHGDVLTREVPPGAHRLQVHNTLFKKTLEFTLGVGEHAHFLAVNRARGDLLGLGLLDRLPGRGPFLSHARARRGALTQDMQYSRPHFGLQAFGCRPLFVEQRRWQRSCGMLMWIGQEP